MAAFNRPYGTNIARRSLASPAMNRWAIIKTTLRVEEPARRANIYLLVSGISNLPPELVTVNFSPDVSALAYFGGKSETGTGSGF
jgi:hypothetical protein